MIRHCIVTSGPTREFFDPIRFLSNPSTGRMGYSIARAAVDMKMDVTYICGPVDKDFSEVKDAQNIPVISTRDMLSAVFKFLQDESILIMAAAPADYRPEVMSEKKMKKKDSSKIYLIANPDILLEVTKYRKDKGMLGGLTIGFAAETHRGEEFALQKLQQKSLNAIFLNKLSLPESGFGSITNQLTLFTDTGVKEEWDVESKEKLGYRVINTVMGLS